MKTIATNRRAFFDYEIQETLEAGLELLGHEVRSVKTRHVSLTGSFVVIKDNEAWLLNAYIPPFQPVNTPKSYEPSRSRKLLLHRREIDALIGASSEKGLTILPLKIYTKRGRVKVEIGIARHKKQIDKRQIIKKREAKRQIARVLKRG